jgi:hypothetical protein
MLEAMTLIERKAESRKPDRRESRRADRELKDAL